jgi:hypothetical protein
LPLHAPKAALPLPAKSSKAMPALAAAGAAGDDWEEF